jgi:hypothetical protein
MAPMPLGAFYRHRRFAGALALLGMAFYAVLVPWHTLSQATLQLSQTSAVTAPCPHAMVGEGSKTSKPEKPRTHCPICNGVAALQIAISAPATPFVLKIAEEDVEQAACEEGVADAPARTPQSRGPPFPT